MSCRQEQRLPPSILVYLALHSWMTCVLRSRWSATWISGAHRSFRTWIRVGANVAGSTTNHPTLRAPLRAPTSFLAAKATKEKVHPDIMLIALPTRISSPTNALCGCAPPPHLVPFSLLLKILENGCSQLITIEEMWQMGFRIMIFSIFGLAPIKGAYEKLKAEGMAGIQSTGSSLIKTFEVCGLKESMHNIGETGVRGTQEWCLR